ncbi:hypothetical protein PLICRDRAFT_171203 [Plicaturopsis crispa FD-325 SS-3]|nr:hypothetical protein PLICRDRAFT_171203 [Plicaturopsis crispa FD-325 SS-3]
MDAPQNSHAINDGAAILDSDAHPIHADSPTTPVSNAQAVKIDMDFVQEESDARHEPVPIRVDVAKATQVDVQMASEPVAEVNGAVENVVDVVMGEEELSYPSYAAENGHTNGVTAASATTTPAADVVSAAATPLHDVPASSHTSLEPRSSYRSHSPDSPPPAKRARVYSDANKASLSHSATPPPVSAEPPPPSSTHDSPMVVQENGSPPDPTPTPTPAPPADTPQPAVAAQPIASEPQPSAPTSTQVTLSPAQYRFCLGAVKNLKRSKESGPFLRPVDPVALGIPHYPSIIKNPMDLSTVEQRLVASNPSKPDPNAQHRYYNAEQFIDDIRLIFRNCTTFNGPDHPVVAMGKRLEESFDKALKNLPAPLEIAPPVVKKPSTPPPPPAQSKKNGRRLSTTVPQIRRNDGDAPGRPKREIHPPPPKDLSYVDAPRKARRAKAPRNDGTAEQLRFCSKLLAEMHKKTHWAIANPFYEPVDWVKLEIPAYPKIVKKPMDLSTMRKKLDNHEYASAQRFWDDFKLMIRNCFSFNPSGTIVNQAGKDLQRLFDEKWKSLPPLHDASDEEDDEDDEDADSGSERAHYAGTIAMMESQIESMRGNIAALKGAKPQKEKKEKKKPSKPKASSSTAGPSKPKQPKPGMGNKRGPKKQPQMTDDDVLTFDQKKDLSEAIGSLDGTKLERVIQIIHEGVPEIRDVSLPQQLFLRDTVVKMRALMTKQSTEEIELEIDLLPSQVLTKLYNFVLRPLRAGGTATGKRARGGTGKGTGTGGLKRKSMDEDVEAEKIRQLEERMAMFEQGGSAGSSTAVASRARAADDSEHSSDSSSGSDSSGSDSE